LTSHKEEAKEWEEESYSQAVEQQYSDFIQCFNDTILMAFIFKFIQ